MKPFASLFRSTPPQTGQQDARGTPATYWSLPPEQLLVAVHATASGLNPADVEPRLKQYGLNALEAQRQPTALGLFLNQFKSPLVLILIGAAIVSAILGEWTDAVIVLAVVLGSTMLGFVQEYRAGNAVEKLRSQVTIRSNGEYTESRAHLQQMISFYDPRQHHEPLVLLHGGDAEVSALSYDACCLWVLGYPEQALKRSQEALSLARELDHPFTLVDVLCYAGCRW